MIDLGYGTTWTYLGHRQPEDAVIVKRYDDELVPVAERQLRALALSLEHGNREAGYRMGVAEKTIKNMLSSLYKRLGVFGKWEAAVQLGWAKAPPELLDASPEATGTVDPVRASGGRSVAGLGRGPSLSPPASTGGN